MNYDHSKVNPDGKQVYVAWFNGIEVQYTDLSTTDNTTTVPDGLQGTVFGAVVGDEADSPTAQEILTGLVMFEIGIPSYVGNP